MIFHFSRFLILFYFLLSRSSDAALNQDASTLCSWLAKQLQSWSESCVDLEDLCKFEGIHCAVTKDVTVYDIVLNKKGLTGALPESLAEARSLRKLSLDSNALTGPLPDAWSTLPYLEQLHLMNNSIHGPLPESWSLLPNLKILDIRKNQLTGALPHSWGRISTITQMKLGNNFLTGSLPSSWSAWTGLKRLRLDNNILSGSLPESWHVFNSLERMDLSNNMLCGSIPASWEAITAVTEKMLFDGNADFFCKVPSTWTEADYSCEDTATVNSPCPEDITTLFSEAFTWESDTEIVYADQLEDEQATNGTVTETSPVVAETGEESILDGKSLPPAPLADWLEQLANPPVDASDAWEDEKEYQSEVSGQEPAFLTVVEEAVLHSCSVYAVTCNVTETGFSEELLVDSAYALSPVFAGRSAHGLKTVDTSRPTRPDDPFRIVITSDADSCTPEAEVVLEVHIRCQNQQFYCESDSDRPFCSLTDLCINLNTATEKLDEPQSITRPLIALFGPPIVQISIGEDYEACSSCMDSAKKCDQGATAWDAVEGNLTSRIEACSTDKIRHYFTRNGLKGCEFNSTKPGTYNLTFTIRDSLGQSNSVVRQLLVTPHCSEGEFICDDVTQCSTEGSCFLSTGKVTNSPDLNLDNLSSEFPTQENNTLSLILMPYAGQYVNLTIGQSYDKCPVGVQPSQQIRCEPGVSPQIVAGQEAEYIVYACPSVSCKYGGVQFCEESNFERYGLKTCEIDTDATAGTVIEVLFMAVPSNSSLPVLSISRFLILESRCGPEEYLCDNTCSPISCNAFSLLFQDTVPIIDLNYPDGLSLAYGMSTEISILPCVSTRICGATAMDTEDGDISDRLIVTETTLCNSEMDSCQFCAPEYVSTGDCLPGYYRYQYSVVDSFGNIAQLATLELNIVEIGEITIIYNHDSANIDSSQDIYSDSVTSLKESIQGRVITAAKDIGKEVEFDLDHLESDYYQKQLRLKTSFVGFGNNYATVNSTITHLLSTGSKAAPLLINSPLPSYSFTRRRLAESTEWDDASMVDIINNAQAELMQMDVQEWDLFLEGTNSTVITQQIDAVLGALVSILGELDRLYQESIGQVTTIIASLRASMPDTTTLEKELMQSIDRMFQDKNLMDQQIIDSLRNMTEFDVVLDGLDDYLSATRSAKNEMSTLMNAQLKDMNHLRDYQGFLTEVESLSEWHLCFHTTEEQRFFFNVPVVDDSLVSKQKLPGDHGTVDRSASKDSTEMFSMEMPIVESGSLHNDFSSIETMLRGATNGRNIIIGGVILQTERSTKEHICHGKFARFIEYCYDHPKHEIDAAKISYGRDPVFLQDSVLYNEYAAVRTERYYDVMRGHDLSQSGIPFGFQPSAIDGELGTHFIYLDIQFGRTTVMQLVQYLKEGQFFDARTKTAVLRFVTVNPQLPSSVLAIAEMKCKWRQSINCDYRIDALPDIQSFTSTTTVLAILLITYWIIIVQQLYRTNHNGNALNEHSADVAVALIMTLSFAVWLTFVRYRVTDLGPRLRFDIYDASYFDGAHWLLTKREDGHLSDLESARWALPENATDLHRLADFLRSMSFYRLLASINSICQTVAIISVILRLLSIASILPRISIITKTLHRCLAPLCDFMLPFTLVMVLFAAMAAICFGHRIQSLSTFANSMETILEFVFFAEGSTCLDSYPSLLYSLVSIGVRSELIPEGTRLHGLEWIMAVVFQSTLALLSIFIFLNFVVAILTDSFVQQKRRSEHDGESTKTLALVGGEIISAINTFQTSAYRRRKDRCIENIVQQIPDHLTEPSGSSTDFNPSVASLSSSVQLEISDSKAIYITDERMAFHNGLYTSDSSSFLFSDDELDCQYGHVPLKRMDDVILQRNAEKDLRQIVEDIQGNVNDLLDMYEAARIWAMEAARDLMKMNHCLPEQTRQQQSI